MVDRVLKGTLHAGFGYLPVLSKGLLVRQLLEEPLVACIPNDYPASARTEIRPQDLDGERMVAFARDHTPSMHSEIEEYYLSFGIELKIVADAFSAEEALTYVEQMT
jgi:DNA-binding transcriptional LysR family regulator